MTTWVLFAGLPGTGKSTLARALAERLGAAVLDKDRVRGALFPGALTDYSARTGSIVHARDAGGGRLPDGAPAGEIHLFRWAYLFDAGAD